VSFVGDRSSKLAGWIGCHEDGRQGSYDLLQDSPLSEYEMLAGINWVQGASTLLCLASVPGSEKVRCSRLNPGSEVPQGKSG